MNQNFAIIGASYLQLPLIKKAKEMGYITHVFAWKNGDVGEKEADYFYPISIIEKEKILEKCIKLNICAICSIASDLATITVNYVANKMGLPGNSMECTELSTNKYKMRQVFQKNGDPSPKYIIVDDKTDLSRFNFTFPVIVKPTDRSGSRGINLVDNFSDLQKAVHTSMLESFEKKALIEDYVDGEEYSVEGVSFHGTHKILTITKKFTTGAPHFIETGHSQPANLNEELTNRIIRTVFHALDSLKISDSASHSEIKIDANENINIIEIGARMGGDCIGSDLVFYSTGIDYVQAVIQIACGIEPNLSPSRKGFPVEVRFILNKEDLKEMEMIQKTERFIKLVSLSPEKIGSATDSSSRAGCYIIKK